MWIVATNVWKIVVFCLLTKSNILRTSSSKEETMNVLPSTESMDSMTNVNGVSMLDFGNSLQIVSIVPVATLIDDKILCMHGGLSPDLTNLDQIRKLTRPTDVPDSDFLCDLLWSDPK